MFKKPNIQILIAAILVILTPFVLRFLFPDKFLLDYLPIVATFFLTLCYVPQTIQTVKTKNVEGLNLWFWIFLNIALTFLLTNAYTIWGLFNTYGYLFAEILNEGLAFVMLALVIKYRKKRGN
jgi:uncharacterized protein with PQ loop repeat